MLLVLVIALTSGESNDSLAWAWSNYLMFALPQWVWATAVLQLGVSKAKAHGGFLGAHILLIAVSFFVLRSNVPEAANGWLLYWFGAPVAVAFGAFIGGWVGRRASRAA
jgi:hypothetical protein